MRLVSKFHDVYDPLFKYGMSDKSFTFVREQREISLSYSGNIYSPSDDVEDIDGNKLFVHFYVVGFCSRIYPCIKFYPQYSTTGTEKPTVWIYNVDQLCKRFPIFNQYRGASCPKFLYFSKGKNAKKYFYHKYVSWLENSEQGKHLEPTFLKYRCAYFLYDGMKPSITLYPILKILQFQKNFPSIMEMFQRLEMYLLNDLAQLDVVKAKPISDKLKAETHGFDHFSFRKESTKRKRGS